MRRGPKEKHVKRDFKSLCMAARKMLESAVVGMRVQVSHDPTASSRQFSSHFKGSKLLACFFGVRGLGRGRSDDLPFEAQCSLRV